MNKIMFRGIEAYITDENMYNLEKRTDMYYYDLRHGDDDSVYPCSIENVVLINRWGTICFKQPIEHLMTQWAEGRYEILLTEEEAEYMYCEASDYSTRVNMSEI